MRITVPLLAAFMLLLLGSAQAADDERRALQQSRQAIEARFKADSDTCRQQFFVNTCLERARSERLSALKPLQERELALSEAERKARSEAQVRRVEERQREFAAEEGRRRTEAIQQSSSGTADAGGRRTAASSSRPLPVDPQAHARDINRQSEEAAQAAARAREQSDKRQRLVLQHQQDFERRQEERRAGPPRKPAQPLPIPSAEDIAAAASAAGKR